MTLIEWLDKLDKIVLIIVHRDSDFRLLDPFFLTIRNALTWIPLYGFLLYFVLKKNKKTAWLFIILSIVTFAVCDRISAGLLKPLFERPRPCFDPEIRPLLRNIIDCGGLYSFPSSHAANHFGIATFWYWSIYNTTGAKWKWLWIWAFLIGYAQIYVGKHYPFDIIAGSLLGIIIGTLMAKFFEAWPDLKKNFKPDFSRSGSLEE